MSVKPGYKSFTLKSYDQAFFTAQQDWQVPENTFSVAIKNQGDEDITFEGGMVLTPGESRTYGNQWLPIGGTLEYVPRDDVFTFTFAGGGFNPNLLITTDRVYV